MASRRDQENWKENQLMIFLSTESDCATVTLQAVPESRHLIEGLRTWHLVCGSAAGGLGLRQRLQLRRNSTTAGQPSREGLQPTARKVGITKKIGRHTFRRTYSSLPAATGDDVNVVQELMCHAKISTTMEVYAQTGMEKKCAAQRRAVDVLLDRKPTKLPTSGQNGKVPDCSLEPAGVPGSCGLSY
jgi:integrase